MMKTKQNISVRKTKKLAKAAGWPHVWTGKTLRKFKVKRVRSNSTTLRNLASVKITRNRDGTVGIVARRNPAKRRQYKPRIKGGYAGDRYERYWDYREGKILSRKKRKR
jgi:hypothetical protein